jgi:opacity protein-like surface antigen
MLGAGAQYQLNQNLYMRGEWEHSLNIGADSAYETDADTYSVGVMYSTL